MHIQDPRSKRQRFCHQVPCKRASRALSQRQWLSKPQNRDYFAGPLNTERVREWRKSNPGYWRKWKPAQGKPLQDLIDMYLAHIERVAIIDDQIQLQDFIKAQTAIMVGFTSIFSGTTQQDEIATILRSCLVRGGDVFGNQTAAVQGRGRRKTNPGRAKAHKHRLPAH